MHQHLAVARSKIGNFRLSCPPLSRSKPLVSGIFKNHWVTNSEVFSVTKSSTVFKTSFFNAAVKFPKNSKSGWPSSKGNVTKSCFIFCELILLPQEYLCLKLRLIQVANPRRMSLWEYFFSLRYKAKLWLSLEKKSFSWYETTKVFPPIKTQFPLFKNEGSS